MLNGEYQTSCVVGPGEAFPEIVPPPWMLPNGKGTVEFAWRYRVVQPDNLDSGKAEYELVIRKPCWTPPNLEGYTLVPVSAFIN